MAQLQFQSSELDPRFVKDGEGAAFQQLIFELNAPELPHLHQYPAAGKDGGIDHLTDEAGKPRVVVECKFCGTDGYDEVKKRWAVTKGNLERNLALSDGPGQAQYRPWYRLDEPIIRYILTTSARLENPAKVDLLRDEIRDFFHGLAAKHPHLAHLGGLLVEVHDWNYIEGKIPAFLRFRWFLRERPNGLRLLATDDENATGFRAWLRSSTLPFYSRATHLAIDPAPHTGDLRDETALLESLNNDLGTLGMVLAGRGGVGKTRLALEIGHTAAADGWTVWVVRRRLKPETIDELAARMDAGARALLIFDYVETHPEFTTVIQHLADIVDDTNLCIRYVATCRSSYYNTIKGADRQRVVALSAAKPAAEEWLVRYRRATVEHILNHAGIPLTEENKRACHDLPVLAAFLHWLHHRGRTEELKTLLGEEDFGRWVIHRVQLSFPGRNLDHSLARLIALFPIPASGRNALTDDETDLFYRLEQDGWIERADDPTAGAVAWQTAHDVLADRVALEWLGSIGNAAPDWCAELLREAVRFHALPSALRSLQRLAEHLSITEPQWERLLEAEIRRAPDEWRSLRSTLLRTSLVAAPARVRLIQSLSEVFTGAEIDGDFQSALGELLRQLVETKSAGALDDGERKTLFDWVRRTIPHQKRLQYLRAWALRAAPDEFHDETLAFIEATSDHIATQYILCAWLYADQDPAQLNSAIRSWCAAHSTKAWFSFVAEAWLGGAGDPLVIQPYLQRWFAKFIHTLQASFVLSSWLKHANAPEVVKESVTQWLDDHGKSLEASHVLSAWLEHANAPEVVKESVTQWLGDHGKSLEASHVLAGWLDFRGTPAIVEQFIVDWLPLHAHTFEEGSYVLRTWLRSGADYHAAEPFVLEWLTEHGEELDAQFVLAAWLKAKNPPEPLAEYVRQWMHEHGTTKECSHVLGPWLDCRGDFAVVRPFVGSWLTDHGAEFEASHVIAACLRANAGRTEVRNAAIDWLSLHSRKFQASFILEAWLKHRGHPPSVRTHVEKWLAAHGTDDKASRVICAWLQAHGEVPFIRPAVIRWLRARSEADNTSFVLFAWLNSNGDTNAVEQHVHQFLASGTNPNAVFALRKVWNNARSAETRSAS